MFSVIKIKYLYYVHTIIYNILIYELEYYKLEFDMSCHDIIRATLVLTMYINT